MKLFTTLLTIIFFMLVFLIILDPAYRMVTGLRQADALIDTSGPGVNEITIPTPNSTTDIVVEWNTTTGLASITEKPGTGKVYAHVPPDTVIAMRNETWYDYLVNDGSDGQAVVEPYREYVIEPGHYYYHLLKRPRSIQPVISTLSTMAQWILPIYMFILALYIMHVRER